MSKKLQKNCSGKTAKNTQGSKKEWNWDTRECIQKSRLISFGIKSATNQREIVIRFLIFYATGHLPNTHTAEDLILAAAHLIFQAVANQSNLLCWSSSYDYTDEEDLVAFHKMEKLHPRLLKLQIFILFLIQI